MECEERDTPNHHISQAAATYIQILVRACSIIVFDIQQQRRFQYYYRINNSNLRLHPVCTD